MAKQTGASTPQVVIEGLEEIIERDLVKHKALNLRSQQELQAYRAARSQEIKKKKHYVANKDNPKYSRKAMRDAIDQININIRQWSDKCKLSEDAISHHTLIVDTLTRQLAEQTMSLRALKAWRKKHGLLH